MSEERRIIRLEETESTNLYLRRLLRERRPEEGLTVVADYQAGGRGQAGNAWFSSKGENLLFSLLIYPQNVSANRPFIISRIASLAVKRTLDRFADGFRIKWPNDIYRKGRKIAGILIENDIENGFVANSIIGIGININQREFPGSIPNPVSLRQITGATCDREHILSVFREEFFLLYREAAGAVEKEYMRCLLRAEGFYRYEDENGRFTARISDVLPSGHLVLTTADTNEERIYAFKEVAFII
jgi:BirA family biotin operon repressor/biotin-[acetyl-CoA-carboxylase] ligase